jgi:hypothetical protein
VAISSGMYVTDSNRGAAPGSKLEFANEQRPAFAVLPTTPNVRFIDEVLLKSYEDKTKLSSEKNIPGYLWMPVYGSHVRSVSTRYDVCAGGGIVLIKLAYGRLALTSLPAHSKAGAGRE